MPDGMANIKPKVIRVRFNEWGGMLEAMDSVESRLTPQFALANGSGLAACGNMPRILVATIFCCLSTSGADSAVERFRIALSGQAVAEIVIESEHSAAPISFAAEELRRYVKAMSGAELPLARTLASKPAIVLASRPIAQDKGTLEQMREEDSYRLNVDPRKLLIEGASPRAVLFGVYDVLERLGCGWCVPGDDAIPKKETLAIAPLKLDARPAFQYRLMLDFPMLSVAQTVAICDWIAKNRMNWVHECPNAHGEPKAWYDRREQVVPELKKRGLRLLVGGHTMHTWVAETNFDSHPDWFAYTDSGRKPPTLCVTHPEMTSELIKNMERFLDRCPEVDVVDLWHTDSEVFCHCPKCTRGVLADPTRDRQVGSVPFDAVQSAYVISYLEFVNRVAEAIASSHPKVMVGPLIYSQTDHAMPDGCPAPRDNVLLGLAHFFRDSYRPLSGEPKSAINLRFLGNDLTWIAKSKHSYIYEYYNGWTAPYIYPGAQVIARDLETLQVLPVQGVSSDMYGYSPINMYVAARALWSPGILWQDTVRDFCRRYYGEVGDEMSDNYLRLEAGIYGLAGYQASGAQKPEEQLIPTPSGLYLKQQRAQQIKFLNGLISRTSDRQVKVRLERALKPWFLWNKEPRFWAFPDFIDSQ